MDIIPYMHCGICIACRNGKPNCCTDMKVLGVHIDGGAAVQAAREPKERLSELTGGDFPTVVFDATGNATLMMDAVELTASGGKLVYVGLVKGDIMFRDPEFHRRELTLMGSRNATKEDFDVVSQVVRGGEADAVRYITHRSSFEGMIGEFKNWLKPDSNVIKAMVEM